MEGFFSRGLTLGLLLVFGAGLARADEVIPVSPLDTVTVKKIPSYPMIEAELTGPIDKVWEHGFRQVARYATGSGMPLQFPVVMIYPETDKPDWMQKAHFFLHLPLPPQDRYPTPREAGLNQGETHGLTVACYAFRGAYTAENFQKGLAKIQEYLARGGVPAIGPPRWLYYSVTSWLPTAWWVSEVQVPIPERTDGN